MPPIPLPPPTFRTSALFLALVAVSGVCVPSVAQSTDPQLDTIQVGRFDMGKMWTFEYAPETYFSETYGFQADPAWFDRARMAALRIPGCSAAFVSPSGLVVTNHHCARGAVVAVTQDGESLLDEGFYAPSLEEERRIPRYYVDQLVAAHDVSDEIFGALDPVQDQAARDQVRNRVASGIQDRLRAEHEGGEGDIRVEITPLYSGGRYSAYVYRRYTDVRLVAAAELQLGFFGGDPDNFTYPRYALDFTFLRVYGSDGEPLRTEHFFNWSQEGVEEGDAVFIIGNPGPTNRLNTVAQLEFQRDVSVKAQKAYLASRLAVLREFYEANRREGEAMGLRNQMFGLSNSLKANTGRLDALGDPVILARKAKAEEEFAARLDADPTLSQEFGGLLEELARIQEEKREVAAEYSAFAGFGNPSVESVLILRSLAAMEYLEARRIGAPSDTLEAIRNRLSSVPNRPSELEEALLQERLQDFSRNLGPDHPITETALEGRSPEGAAASLLSRSVLGDSDRAIRALDEGTLDSSDPAVRLAAAILPVYGSFQMRYGGLTRQERSLAADLGRARFAAYGTDVPPDASRSPRITDGVVKPYEYNGTLAPVYTTFFGLYDHFFSYGTDSDWDLPERWLPPPPGLDLTTPLNFISTADTYGGNSGSPAVTKELEIVGLNFDRNIEGLSRDFIYLPDRGRNIMVDVRAILEAMDKVYDGDRIVQEVLTHRLFRTEAEADAAMGG